MPVSTRITIVDDDVKALLDIGNNTTLLEVLQAIGYLEKIKQELLKYIELEEEKEPDPLIYYPIN